MDDDDVAALLDSSAPLVAIEAPAGCGKTFQGAGYARRAASGLDRGQVLILTHTHAACSVFAKETRESARKVEIKTIDSLIVQIAAAYHKSLNLPADPAVWARQNPSDGFSVIASRVSKLLASNPMICAALAERYPVLIGDEHQDSSADQHAIMMTLFRAGARLRVFGDPMQRIYGKRTQAAIDADRSRWEELKQAGAFGELENPHRWKDGSPNLGLWILQARHALRDRRPVDLTGPLPHGLMVLFAENIAQTSAGYQLNAPDRAPVDAAVKSDAQILVLTGQNETAKALRAFWNRTIPIWEGHTRDALGELVTTLTASAGDPNAVCQAVIGFIGSVATGFSPSSHGNRMAKEVAQGCTKATKGKPARIQDLGRFVLDEPNHVGAANCLKYLVKLKDNKVSGFETVKIDYRSEYRDAMRLADFAEPEDGLAEINRRRSFARPVPPQRAISTIHKAKGLECDNAVIIPCDRQKFSATDYSRCRLYVALSRAKRSLTIVLSRKKPSPLFQLV
jgi:DNA helicase-2/ATP-dependent DNA helicase PcrA